jgi:hypothetical protein
VRLGVAPTGASASSSATITLLAGAANTDIRRRRTEVVSSGSAQPGVRLRSRRGASTAARPVGLGCMIHGKGAEPFCTEALAVRRSVRWSLDGFGPQF